MEYLQCGYIDAFVPSPGSCIFYSQGFSTVLLSSSLLPIPGQKVVVLSHLHIVHNWELTALFGRGELYFFLPHPFAKSMDAELDVEALQSTIFACAHHFCQ